MILVIQSPDDDEFNTGSGNSSSCQRGNQTQNEGPGCGGNGGGTEGADHVERTMGKVDQTHDAEDQCQTGGHQEQHDAELQAVQDLLNEQYQRH